MNFENEKLTPPKLPLFKGMRFGRDAVVPAIVFGCLALGIYFFLVIAGKVDTLRDGIALAEETLDSGRALATLEKLIEVSNRELE